MDPSGNSPIEHAQLYDNQAARLRVGSPLLDPELLRSGETTESKNQANGREPVKRLSRDRGLPNQKVVKVESKSSGPFTPTAASADVESTVVPLSQVTIKEAPLPESIEKLKVTKGREDFRKLYTKRGHWNHPDTEYDSSAKLKLTERRALVIAIQYPQGAGGCIRSLPGAFLDGLNVANMLEKQYGYPPHCIRVLADQVNVDNTKDRKRWPTKENIIQMIHNMFIRWKV
ncbi:hypothetical protein FRC09_006804 [Ceratobasidium sp. 395]|nr:hypothetical protein FRC09_006804 [Ceratobasidium sp. 395]